jgi:radical SAM protein with 4Fe4S-binding SPASM domain
MESLSLLKEYSISTNLRATFSPKIGSLVSVFDFFEKLELPYAYSFTINTDYKSNAGDTCFDNERFDAIAEELKRVMDYFVSKITNNETVFCTGLISKLHTVKYRQKKTHACEAGRRSLTVNEQGDYYACQNMLPYKHTGLGNVNVGIDPEARRKFGSKELEQLPGCSRCVIRKLCAGGCEVERLNADHKPDSQACKFARIEWEAILYAYSRLMEIKAQRDKKAITQYCN